MGGTAGLVRLRNQPSVRLMPANVLEPRLRMVEDGRVIEGAAFDMAAVMAEHQVPVAPVRASPTMREKVLESFSLSSKTENRLKPAGEPGTYYAGTTLPAAIEEIRYHLESDAGIPFDKTRVYRVITARIDGLFVDLRGTDAKALNPDPRRGYPAGARLAAQARGVADGILYPSVRHPAGTCLAVFEPTAVSDIRLDRLISFEPIKGSNRRFGYRLHVQPHQLAVHGRELAMA